MVFLLPLWMAAAEPEWEAELLSFTGEVRIIRAGATTADLPPPNLSETNRFFVYPGDDVQTGERARARFRLRDGSISELDEVSALRPKRQTERSVLEVLRGRMSFFHRDKPGRVEVSGKGVSALVRGTEFTFEVKPDGRVELTLFDGEVGFTNAVGGLTLQSGDIAEARPGEMPRRTAVLAAGGVGAIQWLLYYPAILALPELPLEPEVRIRLKQSLDQYEAGDVLAALASYPVGRQPGSREERVLLAALVLSVGNVAEAEGLLEGIQGDDATARLAAAIRQVVCATQNLSVTVSEPQLASEWLATSYVRQSANDLPGALMAAKNSAIAYPDFGFAWARVAELEFSFGRTAAASAAVARARQLTPRNAQAVALSGFLLAAASKTDAADSAFNEAIELDSGLGNAWLGRGINRIRQGRLEEGRNDLTIAAATEPNRSVLRSYLGKAFAVTADPALARHEFDLARQLDPLDPTPGLYSALLHQQDNFINAAVSDLEQSVALNQERRLYRSRLLLDQDRAVRGANLATVYADAGFTELANREATRAVNADYANAAAHLFLANSYDLLRDPRQINLRYETPWFGEFLLANLLAPVGASSLSQTVSQNEYASLLERDRLGVVSDTLWTGNGDWRESAAQFGRFGNFAYALDVLYRSQAGQRVNDKLEQLTVSGQFKWQLSPTDSLFFQAIHYDAESGDVAQRHGLSTANPGLRVTERQEPLLIAGWHHEWQPGSHTLLLVGRFDDSLRMTAPENRVLEYYRNPDGRIRPPTDSPGALSYQSELSGWTAEVQQLWQTDTQTLIVGARYQAAEFDTVASLDTTRWLFFTDAGITNSRTFHVSPNLERAGLYAYDHWRPISWALLTAGITYDRLTQPNNFRVAPLADGESSRDLVAPKFGVTLTPWRGGVLRGAFTRSLGGVSFDQSFRLEPVQVAGFNQSFRGLIPQALQGSIAGETFETWGVAFDQTLPTKTYLTVSAERLSSQANRQVGSFETRDFLRYAASSTPQELQFVERSLAAAVSQLAGDHLAFTTRYRVSEATLDWSFPEVTGQGFAVHERSILHQLQLDARFNHPCGAFATFTSTWNHQSNSDRLLSGDDFWQHDIWIGYRLLQRRAEVSVGVLNLTGQDYRLHPLNLYSDTYRERTLAIRARLTF
jgi:Flp pilus assembly protein TadD